MQPEYSTYGTEWEPGFFYKALTPKGFANFLNNDIALRGKGYIKCYKQGASNGAYYPVGCFQDVSTQQPSRGKLYTPNLNFYYLMLSNVNRIYRLLLMYLLLYSSIH